MRREELPTSGPKFLLGLLTVFTAYVACGWLGLRLATISDNVSPVWPATGLGIAALVRLGPRAWPAIFLGAFATNLMVPSPPVVAFGIAIGNMLESVFGAMLVARVSSQRKLFREQTETISVFLASALAPLVSATGGVLTLMGAGAIKPEIAGQAWLTWYVGDLVGALVLVPVLLYASEPGRLSARFRSLRHLSRTAVAHSFLRALTLVAAFASASTFVLFVPQGGDFLFLLFPVLLVGLWAFGKSGVLSTGLALCTLATMVTYLGYGPFREGSTNDNLISLQVFMVALSVSACAVAGFREAGPLRRASVTLVIAWIATGSIFFWFRKEEARRDARNYENVVIEFALALESRMRTYGDALRAGVGFVETSPNLSRQDWKRFSESLSLFERYPGIDSY